MKNFLEDLKKIEQRGCNDNSITDLGNLIRYVYDFSKKVELKSFENNFRQTIEKQWCFLNLNKSKPKKRLSDCSQQWQVQPWTKIAVLCFFKKISGLPGIELSCNLYRNPSAKRNLRTNSSGLVFFDLTLLILKLRTSGVCRSVIGPVY